MHALDLCMLTLNVWRFCVCFLDTFSISMYIMCVCLFSALSRWVGALQISMIIIIIVKYTVALLDFSNQAHAQNDSVHLNLS